MERKTHTIDATDKKVGRLATEVAVFLRGKEKADFAPHKDEGDFVSVVNVDKMVWSGKKTQQKVYYRHSGYLGGLKEKKAGELLQERPGEVLRKAVWGMLPKNRLRARLIKRLRVH